MLEKPPPDDADGKVRSERGSAINVNAYLPVLKRPLGGPLPSNQYRQDDLHQIAFSRTVLSINVIGRWLMSVGHQPLEDKHLLEVAAWGKRAIKSIFFFVNWFPNKRSHVFDHKRFAHTARAGCYPPRSMQTLQHEQSMSQPTYPPV